MSLAADIALDLGEHVRSYRGRYEDWSEGLNPHHFAAWYDRHSSQVVDAAALIATVGDSHPLLAGLMEVTARFEPGSHYVKLVERLLPPPKDYLQNIRPEGDQPRLDAQERTARASVAELGGPEGVLSRIVGALMRDAVARAIVERDAAVWAKEDAETALTQDRQAVRAALDVFEAHAAPKPKSRKAVAA